MEDYDILTEIGFSQNEAKTYLALLSSGAALNGYEVAKHTDITRTMIYDVLNRLVQKGAVDVIQSEPKLYVAVDYKRLVSNIRTQSDRRIARLSETLERVAATVTPEKHFVYNINGADKTIRALKRNILAAKREIYLSLWREEAETIQEELLAAHERGVRIYVFSFNRLPFSFGTQYTYGFSWPSDEWFPTRRITAVFDRETLVMGEGSSAFEDISIVTRNTMLIEMAIDTMLLDIWHLYTYKAMGLHREDMTSGEYLNASARMLENLHIPTDLPSGASQQPKGGKQHADENHRTVQTLDPPYG